MDSAFLLGELVLAVGALVSIARALVSETRR